MKNMGVIVVADDMSASIDLLRKVLEPDGYVVHGAADGEAALALVLEKLPDVVLTDVIMPKLNGFELCRRIKAERGTRLTPVVLLTSLGAAEDRIEGIDAGADDFLTKPYNIHELRARVRSLVRLKRNTDDLDSAESVILSLGLTVEARDPQTLDHCERMAAYGAAFGIHLNLEDDDISALHRGGFLHDVGKIGVPDAILLKAGRLTPEERATMERHPVIGDALCGDLRLLHAVRPIVRHHHERLDGTGYPDRLHGDAVPMLAQIMGIVDVYDALTTARVYRSAMTSDAACAELQEEARRGWRSVALVADFVTMCRGGWADKLAEHRPGPLAFGS